MSEKLELPTTSEEIIKKENKSLEQHNGLSRSQRRKEMSYEFEDALFELEVGSLLLQLGAEAVALEPFAGGFGHNKQKSPDYGVRFPGGDFLVEVTIPRTEKLDKWEAEMEKASSVINRGGFQKF